MEAAIRPRCCLGSAPYSAVNGIGHRGLLTVGLMFKGNSAKPLVSPPFPIRNVEVIGLSLNHPPLSGRFLSSFRPSGRISGTLSL